ncbi:MAG: hypothetical protein ACYC35_29585 [Pirellulales bacterium]
MLGFTSSAPVSERVPTPDDLQALLEAVGDLVDALDHCRDCERLSLHALHLVEAAARLDKVFAEGPRRFVGWEHPVVREVRTIRDATATLVEILGWTVPGAKYHAGNLSPTRWKIATSEAATMADTFRKAANTLSETVTTPASAPAPTSVPPMTNTEQTVLDLIRERSPILGKQIAAHLIISESNLTRHIIPRLKMHGVKNCKNVGYYLDPPS